MSLQVEGVELTEEDAFHIIVRSLRKKLPSSGYSAYGYDLYLPNVVRDHFSQDGKMNSSQVEQQLRVAAPVFLSAAWEMARRGIIRPGVRSHREQATEEGSAGFGFSVTPTGANWLQQAGQYDIVPVEPGRFAQMLNSFTPRFGQAYQERAQEAIRCYGANAYLACCAMCGAAAESILLAVATMREGDAEKVEKQYLGLGGRRRVEQLIVGQQQESVRDEFVGYLSLLKYWRDTAAHGRRSGITDNEAYTALAVLLRFSQFTQDRWADLTGKRS